MGGFREFNIALEQKRAYPNSKDDVSLCVWTFQIFMADATRVREQLREILWHKIRYVGGFREFNNALEQEGVSEFKKMTSAYVFGHSKFLWRMPLE